MQLDLYTGLVMLAFFTGSVVFSILINFIFLKYAENLGIRGGSGENNRWSSVQKPAFGGISFYIIFLLSFSSYPVFFEISSSFPNAEMLGLVFATALSFLMGMADDAFNTRPFLKLGIQIASGLILIYTGSYIQLFSSDALNYFLTILWVVGMMNSINMLDNMDAITSVISIIIILSALVLLYISGNAQSIYFFTLLAVLASLSGFLFFNWHPSKIFMGDTGSQFLGVFLAFIGIKFFWNLTPELVNHPILDKFILIMAIFSIPLIDTATVTINRILRKQSPMVGGKDHTTHTLAFLGLNDRQVVIVMAGVAIFFSLAVIYPIANEDGFTKTFAIILAFIFMIILLTFLILNRILLKSKH